MAGDERILINLPETSTPTLRMRECVLLIVLGLFMFIPTLIVRDFWLYNEGRRAIIALEMLRDGDWIIPQLMGKPIVTKPPLFYWLEALSYIITGSESDWAARLPSVVAGVLGLLIFCRTSILLLGRWWGFAATLMLAVTPVYHSMASTAEPEMLFTLGGMLAMLGLVEALHLPDHRRRAFTLFYAGLGLAMMAKGPIVPAISLLTMIMALPLMRRTALLRSILGWWPGWMLALGPILLWIVMMEMRLGSLSALTRELRSHMTEDAPHQQGMHFYLENLHKFIFPWFFLLLAAGIAGFVHLIRTRRAAPPPTVRVAAWGRGGRGERTLLAVWCFVSILIPTLIPSKRDYYALMLAPGTIAFTALLLRDWSMRIARNESASAPIWNRAPWALLAAAVVFLVLGFTSNMRKEWSAFDGDSTLDGKIIMILLGVWCAALGLNALRVPQAPRSAWPRAIAAWGTVCMIGLVSVYNFFLFPRMNRQYSLEIATNEIKALTPAGATLVTYKELHTVAFYLQRPDMPQIENVDDLEDFARANKNVMAIMFGKNWKDLRNNHDFDLVFKTDFIPVAKSQVYLLREDAG